MMMAGLFIMLYAGVALIREKRFFTSEHEEVRKMERILPAALFDA